MKISNFDKPSIKAIRVAMDAGPRKSRKAVWGKDLDW